MSRAHILGSTVLAIALASCEEPRVTEPFARLPAPAALSDALEIEIVLSADSAAPGQPVVASGAATNTGADTLFYFIGCGCDLVTVSMLGPDGLPITWRDPTEPLPLCPCFETTLAPGQGRSFRETFAGTLYTNDGSTFQAPSGTYTFVAGAFVGRPGGTLYAERRASFEWRGGTSWRSARRVWWGGLSR